MTEYMVYKAIIRDHTFNNFLTKLYLYNILVFTLLKSMKVAKL